MPRSRDPRAKPLPSQRGPKRTGPIGTILPGDDEEVAREIQRLHWEIDSLRIPAPSGGDGIQFDVQNNGGWLWVNAQGDPSGEGFWGGINLWDNGWGIIINSYGGDPAMPGYHEGEAVVDITGDDGVELFTDNSVSSMFDGNIYMSTQGTIAGIVMDSDADWFAHADEHMEMMSNTADIEIMAFGAYLYLYGQTDLYLDGTGTGNVLITGLPTSAPSASNAVWNDGGTLKITS